MLTKCSHVMTTAMALMIEQIRIQRCRKMLGQQMTTQFIKCTRFGRLFQQMEMLLQQFHNSFYNGFAGVTIKGTPKLVLDVGDVQYNVSGAFHKQMRKSPSDDKYCAARARVKEEEVESSGMLKISKIYSSTY